MATAALKPVLAALAFAAAGAATAADDLGTLFTTREERARLDQMRRGEPAPAAGAVSHAHAAQVTGFVKRSDGRHTVWIDGLAVPVATPGAERLLDTGTVREYSDRGDDVRIERKDAR